jgi:hypothetical protein
VYETACGRGRLNLRRDAAAGTVLDGICFLFMEEAHA